MKAEPSARPPTNWWDRNIPDRAQRAYFLNGIGDANAPARREVRDYVLAHGFGSLVDCGAGPAVDWRHYRGRLRYLAVDFADVWRLEAIRSGVPFVRGSIEALPLADASRDVAYCRAVLEHLPYYETGLRELTRVASKEVIVTFFKLREQERIIKEEDGTHSNVYGRQSVEDFARALPGVSELSWQRIPDEPSYDILHLRLRPQGT